MVFYSQIKDTPFFRFCYILIQLFYITAFDTEHKTPVKRNHVRNLVLFGIKVYTQIKQLPVHVIDADIILPDPAGQVILKGGVRQVIILFGHRVDNPLHGTLQHSLNDFKFRPDILSGTQAKITGQVSVLRIQPVTF